MSAKDTNPKDAVGTAKVGNTCVSAPVIAEVGLAMLEGARKYGRHNYRVSGVRASVYIDAVKTRHIDPWWEGEDIDPDSDLSHITKAITCLIVLRDSMIQGNWIDDRPPPSPKGWLAELNKKAAAIVAKYPESKEPFLATDTPADVDRKLGRAPREGVAPAKPVEFRAGDQVRIKYGPRVGETGRVVEVGAGRHPYRVSFGSGSDYFFVYDDLELEPSEPDRFTFKICQDCARARISAKARAQGCYALCPACVIEQAKAADRERMAIEGAGPGDPLR